MNNHNQEMCRDMERQQAGYEPAVEDGEDDGQDMLFDIEAEVRALYISEWSSYYNRVVILSVKPLTQDGKFFPRAIGKGQRTPDYSDNQQRLLTFIKLTEPLQKVRRSLFDFHAQRSSGSAADEPSGVLLIDCFPSCSWPRLCNKHDAARPSSRASLRCTWWPESSATTSGSTCASAQPVQERRARAT